MDRHIDVFFKSYDKIADAIREADQKARRFRGREFTVYVTPNETPEITEDPHHYGVFDVWDIVFPVYRVMYGERQRPREIDVEAIMTEIIDRGDVPNPRIYSAWRDTHGKNENLEKRMRMRHKPKNGTAEPAGDFDEWLKEWMKENQEGSEA